MSAPPQRQENAGASRLAHVLDVGTWRGGPQPATFRPSLEDVLATLKWKFGDPEEAERQRFEKVFIEADKAEKAKKAEKEAN